LEPLTLGHLFLLRECEIDLDAPTTSDLIVGVFICATSHEQARRNLNSRWAKWFMTGLGFFCRKLKPHEEAEKFRAYIDHGTRCPKMHTYRNGPARRLGAPEEWRLLVMLEVDFHKSKTEALDLTMREALCRWATESDRQGKATIMNDDERGFWEFAQARDREQQEKN
jgi:hypothetical protein